MEPFARAIHAARKYVVSSTLDRVDWNAELVGGLKLPLALAEPGLIDEYEFVVHPRLAGHGPTLFAGLSKWVDLKLVSRLEFGSGAVAMMLPLLRRGQVPEAEDKLAQGAGNTSFSHHRQSEAP